MGTQDRLLVLNKRYRQPEGHQEWVHRTDCWY